MELSSAAAVVANGMEVICAPPGRLAAESQHTYQHIGKYYGCLKERSLANGVY